MQATMNAISFNEYGSADVLRAVQLSVPVPAADQVLIRVAAAGVNPADWVIRSGQLKLFTRIDFPYTPGLDVAGVVEAVGASVTQFKPGDRVYAMLPNLKAGGYAEYAVAAEHVTALVPSSLPLADAAAIPCAALTALHALTQSTTITPGQVVMINGAAGGVGSFGVQIAKALGARVIGVCSTRNIDFVRDLGADEVIDYTQGDFFNRAQQYDVIFDAVGAYPFGKWRGLLSRTGMLITVNPIYGNPIAKFFVGMRGKQKLDAFLVVPSGDALRQINGMIERGQVRPIISETYSLARAAEAQRASELKHVRGKLVLTVNDSLK